MLLSSVCLQKHEAHQAENSAIQGKSQREIDKEDNGIFFPFRGWMDGNLDKPAICLLVALGAGFSQVFFRHRGPPVILFVNIVQFV